MSEQLSVTVVPHYYVYFSGPNFVCGTRRIGYDKSVYKSPEDEQFKEALIKLLTKKWGVTYIQVFIGLDDQVTVLRNCREWGKELRSK